MPTIRTTYVKRDVTVTVSPTDLAEAFWHMCDDQQAEFFREVKRISEADVGAWKAECQWYYLGRKMRDDPESADALRTISAFAWMEEWGITQRGRI